MERSNKLSFPIILQEITVLDYCSLSRDLGLKLCGVTSISHILSACYLSMDSLYNFVFRSPRRLFRTLNELYLKQSAELLKFSGQF